MIVSVEFQNYRGFSEHILPLKPETVIVGRNNAGKSTVIEGFRIASIITERYKNLTFKSVPDWLDLPLALRGVRPDVSGLNLSWENIFHRYQEPPASIKVSFDNQYGLTIYMGPDDELHATIHDHDGRPIRTKGEAQALDLSRLSVLPHVAPLTHHETILDANYVRRNMSSYLAPTHFRNQLNLLYEEYFNDFARLVESTWSGMQIVELTGEAVYLVMIWRS